MEKWKISATDAYISRIYRVAVLLPMAFCMIASATILLLHRIGWYQDLKLGQMRMFVAMDCVFMAIGIYFYKTGMDENGIVKPDKLRVAKYVLATLCIVQWNAISYIWPFADFWAYCLLFIILFAFFFDIRLVAYETAGIIASMFVSWYTVGGRLLPDKGGYFTADMTFRVAGIILMLLNINIITYFGGKFLKEELEKYVNYDTLTHLLNKRAVGSHLQAAYKQALAGAGTFCIMLIDIDDFKAINDIYGHECGDEVLKYISHAIMTGVKKQDYVFRWSEEEILVLMNTDYERTMAAAERIRRDIERDPVLYGKNSKIPISLTIGVSRYMEGRTIQQIIDDADAKMYYGKKHGKNQVVGMIAEKSQSGR